MGRRLPSGFKHRGHKPAKIEPTPAFSGGVFLSSFACPKEETRKRHPNQSWPCGLPLLLAGSGARKNSGFALRQFPRLFRPRLRGAAGQMGGGEEGKSHWHAAEHRRGCRKGDLHCLRRSRVCKAPAASRSAGHPAFGGTRDTGCPFFGSFLWARKEMNILISCRTAHNSQINLFTQDNPSPLMIQCPSINPHPYLSRGHLLHAGNPDTFFQHIENT